MKHLLFSMIFIVAAINYVKAAVNDEVTIPEIKFSIEHTLPCQAIMADGSRHSVPPKLIDYIEFSKVDSLGFEHSGYVSQIIHLKDSSLIILPIADIKSFEFQTPPTKYADGVTVIDRDGLWEHVLKSEGNSFVLDSSTPSELIPRFGQRLVTMRAEGVFPYGFSGEVKSAITQTDGSTLINCEFVDYTETVLEHVESVILHPYTENQFSSRATNEIPPIHLPFSLESALKTFAKPSSLPAEASVGLSGKMDFIKDYDIELDFTRTILYGDAFIDAKLRVTDRTTFEYSGGFSFAGELPIIETICKKEIKGKIPLGQSGFEFFWQLEIPVSFDMDIAGTGCHVAEKTTYIRYLHSTNKNIKKGKPIDVITKEFKRSDISHQTNFNFSIGPELELGFRNVGYDQEFGEFGLKAFAKFSGGLKLHGNDHIPYEDAATDTYFYDNKADECEIGACLFIDAEIGLHGGVKVDLGSGIGFEWEAFDFKWPWEKNFNDFWKVKKYPYFVSPALNLRSSESSSDKYSYKINTPLASPVHVGYSIIDDNTNEALYSEYSSERYDGKIDEPLNIEFEVPVIASILGRKATIYPLVKPGESEDSWWEKEVLASPGVPIKVDIIPITGESDGVYISEATVYGTIEKYFYLLNSKGHECGFLYSTGNVDSSSPKVKCTLGTKDISAKLSNLKPGTKYYYAAYVKIGDKYIIGKVKNFTTREDEFVDLGLSVKWCFKNVGAQNETDYGNLYAWGETITKSSYVWDNYFDSPYDSEGNVVGCRNKTDDIAGDKEYDVVTSTMPGTRMPTKDEMRELINQCDWNWTAVNGVSGYRITSKVNSNSIFLPAAGIQDGSSCENEGTYGGYWTGTVGSSATKMTAVNLYFTSQTKSMQQGNRYVGRSIRAVMP